MQQPMQFQKTYKHRNTGKWWLPKEMRMEERKSVQKLFNGWAGRIGTLSYGHTITGGDYVENIKRHKASWCLQ
jgi:hypothetical protein